LSPAGYGNGGALTDSLASRVGEFDLLSHAKLDCILSKSDDHIEAAEVEWHLDELITAMASRVEMEAQ
jgi:hypothetical protein